MEKTNMPTKRKRDGHGKSRQTLDSEDSARKRGRPRVQNPDESAADRRRTQIRLAQRAYRQRKENTLDGLQKRVSELTTTIECMHQAFEDCRDRLLKGGLLETQAIDLAEVSRSYKGWLRSVSISEDEEVAASAAPFKRATSFDERPQTGESALIPIVKNVPCWIDRIALQHAATLPQTSTAMGYTMFLENDVPDEKQANGFEIPGITQETLLAYQPKNPTDTDFEALRSGPMFSPTHSLPRELALPRTFSSQEITLARRLHRACMEALYHFVLSPGMKPQAFDRVFKLSTLHRDRGKIAVEVKQILDRGPHQSLDFEGAPQIHIGGAGTHYPQRDQYGNVQARKSSVQVGVVGLQTLAVLGNVVRSQPSSNILLDVEGFEGEWFDPYDVEGYLEEKGIHIDPMASFVGADITKLSVKPNLTKQVELPNVWQHSASERASTWDSEELLGADAAYWENLFNAELGGLGSVGFSNADSWMNFVPTSQPDRTIGQPTASDELPNSALSFGQDSVEMNFGHGMYTHEAQAESSKKTAIIDVSKFIHALKLRGICLGRRPGFKREDVDRALVMSTVEAF